MNSILQQQRRSSIAAALITILLGLVLIFWPDRSIRFLCSMLGALLLITGIVYILGWFARRRDGFPVYALIPGVVLGALGLWLLAIPQSVVALIQYICGAVILFHGVIDFQSAAALVKMRVRRSWLELLLSLLTVGLAVVIFLNPFGTVEALVMLIGWVLVFDGGSDLWIVFRLSRAVRQAQKNGVETESPEPDRYIGKIFDKKH